MNPVRDLMRRGVAERVFPGAVLLVSKEDRVLFLEAFGLARLSPEQAMKTDTVFDLASLTKPLATTLSLMLLVQHGRLALDQPLAGLIADFSATNKQHITTRQLLSHTSGLPDYKPYYKQLVEIEACNRKDRLRAMLVAEGPVDKPGAASRYSDIGFMILEWIVEATAEMPLDRFVEGSIYRPLGLKDLFFVRLNSAAPKAKRGFAATEDCPWRGEVLEGRVHDDNAYAAGGVAGHAGLFGTAQDVYRLLCEILNVYKGKPNSGIFEREMVRLFFKRRSDLGSWALGFDTPSRPDSSSGRYFSDQSVGHLGFTGTSFWMDLAKEVIVVLLTNRVHPSRANDRIKTFRPVLHDAIMLEIENASSKRR